MSSIRILPEKVASQIAAGEVIERPASIVKELMDNSVDAEADRITVKIEKGGQGLIRVTDNGCGMSRDDLLLCLERHATSKISDLRDLLSIRTLGFRGEALPSIGAVSRLEIISRRPDQLIGFRLRATGGKFKSIDETGAPAGTSVEMRDLFFNTPARKKFLRTERTETTHIIELFSRNALPFGHIYFRLDEGERNVVTLPASENETNRLMALFGRTVAASMIAAEESGDRLRIKAYLGEPGLSRAKGDRILLYVNRRNIRDRLLTHAIMEGYGQSLLKGQYPQAAIFIEVDPSLVDVNVHPMKQEVRFPQPRLIHQALIRMIERALKRSFLLSPGMVSAGSASSGEALRETSRETGVAESFQEYLSIEPAEGTKEKKEAMAREIQVLGQLRDTYLLCQVKDGLLMVDQHAAHERIVYETLKRSLKDSKIERQAFLIPPKLELSLKESRVLHEKQGQLAQLGMEVEPFGGETFILRAVPSLLVKTDWHRFFLELIPLLEEQKDLRSEKAMDRLLTVMACHGAIRAGQRLSQSEMVLLLKQLTDMDLPTNCPHGRPIFKKFTFYEIEKMFKRVV